MNITINIDDYLSHEDKVRIAEEEFRRLVREETLAKLKAEKLPNKNMPDYERVVTNAVWYYIESELDKITGHDTKNLISEKVKELVLNKNYDYSLFRSKSAWEIENSPAQQVVIDTVKECRNEMMEKIKSKLMENIDKIDVDQLSELINELLYQVIADKIKA